MTAIRKDGKATKKSYEAPKLEVFGEISALTASGSTGGMEAGSSTNNPSKMA